MCTLLTSSASKYSSSIVTDCLKAAGKCALIAIPLLALVVIGILFRNTSDLQKSLKNWTVNHFTETTNMSMTETVAIGVLQITQQPPKTAATKQPEPLPSTGAPYSPSNPPLAAALSHTSQTKPPSTPPEPAPNVATNANTELDDNDDLGLKDLFAEPEPVTAPPRKEEASTPPEPAPNVATNANTELDDNDDFGLKDLFAEPETVTAPPRKKEASTPLKSATTDDAPLPDIEDDAETVAAPLNGEEGTPTVAADFAILDELEGCGVDFETEENAMREKASILTESIVAGTVALSPQPKFDPVIKPVTTPIITEDPNPAEVAAT